MPLPAPALCGEHGLLDGADGALRKVGVLRRRSEFKREFKKLMDFWDIEKQVTRGHTLAGTQGLEDLHARRGVLTRRSFHVHYKGVWLAPEGVQKRLYLLSGDAGVDLGLLQRLRYAAEAGSS